MMSTDLAKTSPDPKLFWTYAENNHVEGLRDLLSDPTLVEIARGMETRILARAAERGHREAWELLFGAGFGASDGKIADELLVDVCRGQFSEDNMLALVDDLLRQGADPNTSGMTPLHFAARVGYARVAARLIEAGADPKREAYGHGRQPLHEASTVPVAQLLLEQGADINAQSPSGATPLHVAIACKNLEMVTFLLERGADVSIPDFYGNTLLHEIAKYPQGWQNLRSTIELMIKAGVPLNAVNSHGWTPLSVAALKIDAISVLELLLNHGADPNIVPQSGVSPLAEAVSYENKAAAELLLAHGADPLAGSGGRSAIESAVFRNQPDLLRKMLSVVGNVDLSAQSIALLETAAHRDSAECIAMLIPLGVKPGGPFPAKKLTPLHTAARFGAVKLLKLCLDAGASPDVCDRSRRTPLYMAARYNRPDAVTLLLQQGADLTLADSRGKTPLDIAVAKNKKRAIAALQANTAVAAP